MSTTYALADPKHDATGLLGSVMKQHHTELHKAGVLVGILLANAADEGTPAIKHAGYPATAKIKIVPLKDRLTKNFDAELLIDEKEWDSLSDESKTALIDHELCHLSVVLGKNRKAKRDDIGRPKLKLVPGDWNVGDGFEAVVRRHGQDALEYQSVRKAHVWVQKTLFEAGEPAKEPAEAA